MIALLMLLLAAAPAWATKASLVYDGDVVQKTSTVEMKGVDYLPLKTVAAMFKGQTQRLSVADKVTLQLRNRKISFAMNKKTAELGTQKIVMAAPPRLVDGAIYIPAGFFETDEFSSLVDCKVEWNPDTLTLEATPNVTLSPPRIMSRASFTRIVFDSTDPIEFEDKLKGRVLTISIPKARISKEETTRIKDPVVTGVTISKARKGAVIKIDLAEGVTNYHAASGENHHRLTLTVKNPKAPQAAEEEKKLVEAILSPDAPLPELDDPVKKTKKVRTEKTEKKEARGIFSAGTKKIVVDAGHGGEDTGAIGPDHTKEKDINLMTALELARELKNEGYDVFLTRKSDVFISLGDRSLMANQEGADLFISIHCNAAPYKRKKQVDGGFEIYFLSEDATDQQAEDVARFENMEPDQSGLRSDKNRKATEVLFSMARTEFINESALLGQLVSRAVDQRVPIDNRGVKQADFHVLHGVQMPSILIEMAFIDKPSEEKKLRQRKYRSAMVDAIVTGVQNFESKSALLR